MKKRSYRLSDQAFASLIEIAAWTEERFGPAQADRYRDLLIARCRAIAAGQVVHQSCRVAFAPDLREDLRFARAGRHFVIFLEDPATVLVIDFLHQGADLAARLERG